jgi:hypothetical protein
MIFSVLDKMCFLRFSGQTTDVMWGACGINHFYRAEAVSKVSQPQFYVKKIGIEH